jgi:hypothetical protein
MNLGRAALTLRSVCTVRSIADVRELKAVAFAGPLIFEPR